jgi:hypothetical protein
MANSPRYKETDRNTFLDAIDTTIGASGFLDFYDGTQPTNVATALGAQVKLAHLPLSATAFGAAAAGVLTANAITSDASADATGTASWATLTTSAGTRVVDCSVGTSGADINMNSVAFTAGAAVSVSSLTITFPAA